jgi:hypothetical protein
MRQLRPALISVLGFALSVIFASSLVAQQRTFVSAQHGSDANPCSVALPCRTFGKAISVVAAGGEVMVLDSGGYGPFTVAQAVTIESPAGVYAGVSATSGDGIDVSAAIFDIVVLRGLTVYGFSGASNGISYTSGLTLYVENCVINGFPNTGIFQTGHGSLVLSDTTVRNCANSGVDIAPSGGSEANLSVDHCRFEGNNIGLIVYDGVRASVRDSVASFNFVGFEEAANGTTAAQLNIENCLVSNNGGVLMGSGIATANSGPGTIRVSGSTVTPNGIGLTQTAGHTFESYGNNHIRGNRFSDTSGTITTVPNN